MGKNSNIRTFRSLLQALPSIWTLMLGNTTDFRGSSAQPAAPLARSVNGCISVLFFYSFLHFLLSALSPVHLLFILPCLQCPLLTHAAPKAVCEKPLRRDALQTATCERCLRNKCYAHIINSGSHNFRSRLTTSFLFSWAHPSSSCKKLQDVKSFCIILSVSGKDMMELSSLPNL